MSFILGNKQAQLQMETTTPQNKPELLQLLDDTDEPYRPRRHNKLLK